MALSESTSLVLVVTGGIGCGKSEVGRILEGAGFVICDADHVAHDLLKKGSSVYAQLIDYFGPRILGTDGEISRPVLGQIVFENEEKRNALNKRVHPAVRTFLEEWIKEARGGIGSDYAVLLPLLFESRMDDLDWDAVVCVSAPSETVLQRLAGRGLSRSAAEQRVASQWSLDEKEARSHYVIKNNGTMDELKDFTLKTIQHIRFEREL